MDSSFVSSAAQKAIDTRPLGSQGQLLQSPAIRSDNGSRYTFSKSGSLVASHIRTNHRIRPHCPEENGFMNRAKEPLTESPEDQESSDRYEAEKAFRKITEYCNLNHLPGHLSCAIGVARLKSKPTKSENSTPHATTAIN
jgi:hypothetical protein